MDLVPDPEGLLNYPAYARIIPRIAGLLSLLGSVLIAYDLVSRKRLAKVHHRILFGMSLADIVSSICTVLGRIPVVRDDEVFPGYGNQVSCTTQGFLYQSVLAVLSYNLCLAIYYVLLVCYNWTEPQIARFERAMHLCSVGVFLGSAITLASLRMFNPDYFVCFIQSSPAGCVEDCDRGGHPSEYRWAFFYGPAWTMIVCITVLMLLLYYTVWKQERRMDQFVFGVQPASSNLTTARGGKGQQQQQPSATQSNTDNTSAELTPGSKPLRSTIQAQTPSYVLSRRVAVQGLLYTVPFYVTWIFPLAAHALGPTWIGQHGQPLLILVAIFLPLQGLGNGLVYARPLLLQQWEKRKERSTTAAVTTSPATTTHSTSGPIRREASHV